MKFTILSILVFWISISQMKAQSKWALEDLSVTTFRNGDVLFHVQSLQDLQLCNQNKLPAYYKLDMVNGSVLYNFYALTDSRGLAPEGYKLATQNDLSVLTDSTYYQAPNNSWKTRGKGASFFAEPNGYLPYENVVLMNRSYAGYYWISSNEDEEMSKVFIFKNDLPGFTVEERPKEEFYSVRCVANENEMNEFNKTESKLLQSEKFVNYKKIAALDEKIAIQKEVGKELSDEKEQVSEYLSSVEQQISTKNMLLDSLKNNQKKNVLALENIEEVDKERAVILKEEEERRKAEEKERSYLKEYYYKRDYGHSSYSTELSGKSLSKIESWFESHKRTYGKFEFTETYDASKNDYNIHLVNQKVNGPKYALYSLILPGFGKYKVTYGARGKLTAGIFGVSLVTTVLTGFYSNYMYDKYLKATSQNDIQKSYNLANNSHKIFLISGGLTLTVYTAEFFSALRLGAKNNHKKNFYKLPMLIE